MDVLMWYKGSFNWALGKRELLANYLLESIPTHDIRQECETLDVAYCLNIGRIYIALPSAYTRPRTNWSITTCNGRALPAVGKLPNFRLLYKFNSAHERPATAAGGALPT